MPDQVTLDMMALRRRGDDLRKERAERAKRQRELRENYLELVMAVKRKWPGENRHETALRYIQEAEGRVPGFRGKVQALVARLEH